MSETQNTGDDKKGYVPFSVYDGQGGEWRINEHGYAIPVEGSPGDELRKIASVQSNSESHARLMNLSEKVDAMSREKDEEIEDLKETLSRANTEIVYLRSRFNELLLFAPAPEIPGND